MWTTSKELVCNNGTYICNVDCAEAKGPNALTCLQSSTLDKGYKC